MERKQEATCNGCCALEHGHCLFRHKIDMNVAWPLEPCEKPITLSAFVDAIAAIAAEKKERM